jgi:alginate O-acetyltransferase complex protein AlgI
MIHSRAQLAILRRTCGERRGPQITTMSSPSIVVTKGIDQFCDQPVKSATDKELYAAGKKHGLTGITGTHTARLLNSRSFSTGPRRWPDFGIGSALARVVASASVGGGVAVNRAVEAKYGNCWAEEVQTFPFQLVFPLVMWFPTQRRGQGYRSTAGSKGAKVVFSSAIFLLLFLPVVLILYHLLPLKLRNLLLLLASLAFYFWGEGKYVSVMLAYMVVNWFVGRLISRFENPGTRLAALWLGLAFNIGALLYFKYWTFLVQSWDAVLGIPGGMAKDIHLPIGISFFSFQAISYLIDVYFRTVEAQRSLVKFSMYKSFFPQLIAGPIVRYADIKGQIDNRSFQGDLFVSGMGRFVVGLAKKTLVANSVGVYASQAFSLDPSHLSIADAWLGLGCYALQIYFDFSGYSDMAIGLGRMFGFRFLENFLYPYSSRSVKEFWRRWHISLSSWFRDYLYIPLGGNRKGVARGMVNLVIVFAVCGLWHGASWTFLVWGLWHGLFLVLERTQWGRVVDSLPRFVQRMYLLLVVLVGWVFFRADTLDHSWGFLRALFVPTAQPPGLSDLVEPKVILAILAGCVLSFPLYPWLKTALGPKFKDTIGSKIAIGLALAALFVLSLGAIAIDSYNPFIYFRF